MTNVNIVNKPGVNADGKLTLPAIVCRLTDTPQPLFGKNVKDWGAEEALAFLEADEADPGEHDFGTCFIRPGSLRQLVEGGEYFVDLTVDNPREIQFQKPIVDNEGDLILKSGNPMYKTARTTEKFVTVPLSMVEWLPAHADSQRKGETVEYCQRKRSKATAADTIAYALNAAGGSKKTKSVRPSPTAMKALLAQIGG